MVRLGGADFDSDTALVIRDETIKAAVKRLENIKWMETKDDGAMVALADESLKGSSISYNPTPCDMAILDSLLCDSKIGVISDDVQLCNCIMWDVYNKHLKKSDEINNNKVDDFLKTVYDYILQLSLLNQLEIDRPKHSIEIVPDDYRIEIMGEVIEKAKEVYKDEKYIEKPFENSEKSKKTRQCLPLFLYEKKGKSPLRYKRESADGRWDVPTDYIYETLEDEKNNIKNAKPRIARGTAKELDEFFELEDVKFSANTNCSLIKFLQKLQGL